jgi:hypothetical protein
VRRVGVTKYHSLKRVHLRVTGGVGCGKDDNYYYLKKTSDGKEVTCVKCRDKVKEFTDPLTAGGLG